MATRLDKSVPKSISFNDSIVVIIECSRILFQELRSRWSVAGAGLENMMTRSFEKGGRPSLVPRQLPFPLSDPFILSPRSQFHQSRLHRH